MELLVEKLPDLVKEVRVPDTLARAAWAPGGILTGGVAHSDVHGQFTQYSTNVAYMQSAERVVSIALPAAPHHARAQGMVYLRCLAPYPPCSVVQGHEMDAESAKTLDLLTNFGDFEVQAQLGDCSACHLACSAGGRAVSNTHSPCCLPDQTFKEMMLTAKQDRLAKAANVSADNTITASDIMQVEGCEKYLAELSAAMEGRGEWALVADKGWYKVEIKQVCVCACTSPLPEHAAMDSHLLLASRIHTTVYLSHRTFLDSLSIASSRPPCCCV